MGYESLNSKNKIQKKDSNGLKEIKEALNTEIVDVYNNIYREVTGIQNPIIRENLLSTLERRVPNYDNLLSEPEPEVKQIMKIKDGKIDVTLTFDVDWFDRILMKKKAFCDLNDVKICTSDYIQMLLEKEMDFEISYIDKPFFKNIPLIDD